MTGEIFSLLKRETYNNDPYKDTRTRCNKMFLDQIPKLKQEINESNNPFLESIKYSIIGNIIDFNPIHDLSMSDIVIADDIGVPELKMICMKNRC